MPFALLVKPQAQKSINKLSVKDRGRVLSALEAIQADPYSGKKLHGQRMDEYSARVWPYRLVYKIYKEKLVVVVVEFDHRQGVYGK